ncbi:hypothetical protein DFJ77DRAFT_515045 [Powellomyces hirtus]|nr:hypothetical protein DFJ77DRAFT_515045 [Powellomyces hirtus]
MDGEKRVADCHAQEDATTPDRHNEENRPADLHHHQPHSPSPTTPTSEQQQEQEATRPSTPPPATATALQDDPSPKRNTFGDYGSETVQPPPPLTYTSDQMPTALFTSPPHDAEKEMQTPTHAAAAVGPTDDSDDEVPLATLVSLASSESLRTLQQTESAASTTHAPATVAAVAPATPPPALEPVTDDDDVEDSPTDTVLAPVDYDIVHEQNSLEEEDDSENDADDVMGAEIRNAFLSGRMRDDDYVSLNHPDSPEATDLPESSTLPPVEATATPVTLTMLDVTPESHRHDSYVPDAVFADAPQADHENDAAAAAAASFAVDGETKSKRFSWSAPADVVFKQEMPAPVIEVHTPKEAPASADAADPVHQTRQLEAIDPALQTGSSVDIEAAGENSVAELPALVVSEPQSAVQEQPEAHPGPGVLFITPTPTSIPATVTKPAPLVIPTSYSSVSLVTPSPRAEPGTTKPAGLNMSHTNKSAPLLGRPAKAPQTKKKRGPFAACMSWFGLGPKKDTKAPASASALTATASPSIHKGKGPALADEPMILHDVSTGKPPYSPVGSQTFSLGMKASVEQLRLAAIAAATAKSPAATTADTAPRSTSELGPSPDDSDSITSSERRSIRSIFREKRNQSTDRGVSAHSDAGSSRRRSMSVRRQRSRRDENESETASRYTDKEEDEQHDAHHSAEVYTLHSKASQLTLVLPDIPKLGDLDVAIPPPPARTEMPNGLSSLSSDNLSIGSNQNDKVKKSMSGSMRSTATARSMATAKSTATARSGQTERSAFANSAGNLSRNTSIAEKHEDEDRLDHLRSVVSNNTRSVKESAAAHRRRWDEELQGSVTGTEGTDKSKSSHEYQSTGRPSTDNASSYRTVPSRASRLYDSRAAVPSTTPSPTPTASTKGAATAATPALNTSPSRLFLNQDFGLGSFDASPFHGSHHADSNSKPVAELDPLEKLYHDICSSGMDLDQLAGKYDASATRRPTVTKEEPAPRSVKAAAQQSYRTPPQTPPPTASTPVAEEPTTIDHWRRNIARALESTSTARSAGPSNIHAITKTGALMTPPASPSASALYNNTPNHNNSTVAAHNNSSSNTIKQPLLLSSAARNARNNTPQRNVWSLHEDFAAAVEGEDGDSDLAGVIGYALAVGDGQA